MSSQPLRKLEEADEPINVLRMFFTPMEVKLPPRTGFLRQTIRAEANEKRGWGRRVAGIFSSRLSH